MYELFGRNQFSNYYDELIQLYASLDISVCKGDFSAADQAGHIYHKAVLHADKSLAIYMQQLEQLKISPSGEELKRICDPLFQQCEVSVKLLRQKVDTEKENVPATPALSSQTPLCFSYTFTGLGNKHMATQNSRLPFKFP